jgi:4-hydroxyphenylpyruvate dioxygenase
MVGNVGWNEMNTWVKFYEEVMDLLISFLWWQTNQYEYSALMSKVMSNGNGRIKFPINEPAEGKKNHKLRNIWFYGGPEFSISLLQQMIIKTVIAIESKRNRFFISTRVLWSYTRALGAHMEWWKKILTKLKTSHHGRCWWGRVFIANFTKPVQDRPTFFWNYSKNGSQVLVRETLKSFWVNWERTAIARNVIKAIILLWKK